MAAGKLVIVACGIGFAIASTSLTAAGRSVGLKEINYVREPLTSLLRPPAGAPLTPQQVKEALERCGFHDVAAPRTRGHLAILAATAPRGERVTLVVDLSNGEIAGVRLQAVPDSKPGEKR